MGFHIGNFFAQRLGAGGFDRLIMRGQQFAEGRPPHWQGRYETAREVAGRAALPRRLTAIGSITPSTG